MALALGYRGPPEIDKQVPIPKRGKARINERRTLPPSFSTNWLQYQAAPPVSTLGFGLLCYAIAVGPGHAQES